MRRHPNGCSDDRNKELHERHQLAGFDVRRHKLILYAFVVIEPVPLRRQHRRIFRDVFIHLILAHTLEQCVHEERQTCEGAIEAEHAELLLTAQLIDHRLQERATAPAGCAGTIPRVQTGATEEPGNGVLAEQINRLLLAGIHIRFGIFDDEVAQRERVEFIDDDIDHIPAGEVADADEAVRLVNIEPPAMLPFEQELKHEHARAVLEVHVLVIPPFLDSVADQFLVLRWEPFLEAELVLQATAEDERERGLDDEVRQAVRIVELVRPLQNLLREGFREVILCFAISTEKPERVVRTLLR